MVREVDSNTGKPQYADEGTSSVQATPRAHSIRIGLMWHSFSSTNLGVAALSWGQAEILQRTVGRHADMEWVLLGYVDDCGQQPPEVVDVIRSSDLKWHWPSVVRSLRRCSLILDASEGDSFSDIYGWRRFAVQSVSKIAALLSGSRLILSPQTIGPFRHAVSRLVARYILERAAYVFARDEESATCAKELAPRAQVHLSTDLALAWELDHHASLVPSREKDAGTRPTRVGLNVSGLLFSHPLGAGLHLDYRAFVDGLIERLIALGCEVHLVPHVLASGRTGSMEDDYAASRKVHAKWPSVVLPEPYSEPRTARTYISKMDFFVGSRMHSTVAAFASGVPFVAMAYSRKFRGLFSSLGYEAVCDARSCDTESAIAFVERYLLRREELRKQVVNCWALARERGGAYTEVVKRELFREGGDSTRVQ